MAILTYPKFQSPDINGVNLSGGKVNFYVVGTSTRKDTYSDKSLSILNTNPVILDSRGEADIYLDGSYKIVLTDENDVEIWSEASYSGVLVAEDLADGNHSMSDWWHKTTATYISATTFSVSDVSNFHVGRRVKTNESAYGVITDVTGTTITVELSSGSLTASLASVQLGPAPLNPAVNAVQYISSKSVAIKIQPDISRWLQIGGSDGGLFYAVTDAAPGTYADNGGAYCGTVIANADGSAAWVREGSREVKAEWFCEEGAADVSVELQGVADYMESQPIPLTRLVFGAGEYKFTGVQFGKQVSLFGAGSYSTKFVNTGPGKMISYSYVGVTDTEKRNFLTVNDIGFLDSGAGTGQAIYTNLFFFIEFNRCFFEGFTAGYGINAEEALCVVFNDCNTDGSNIRIKSVLSPHYNNVVAFNGGEYRNPNTYAIECDTADVVQLRGVTIEGDSGGTTGTTRACSFKDVSMLLIDGIYAEYLRTSDSVLQLTNCRSVKIARSNIGSQSDTVPSIHLIDTSDVEISECVLNWFPLKTEGNVYNVKVKRCSFWGKIDVSEGNGVKFEDCSPNNTATCIPIDPNLQSFDGAGVPMKNWYSSSGFEFRDPTVDTSGTATMTYETSQGYFDNYSLKISAIGVQDCTFSNMGTTDNTNDGAIISFMAKADKNTEVNLQGSISTTLGNAKAQITTEWKRFFVFTLLSTAGAGAGIGVILTTTETCDIWVDDIQTVAYGSYKEAAHLFSNFRYVPTYGTKITTPQNENAETEKKHLNGGLLLRPLSAVPSSPQAWEVQCADGVGWNPGAGGGLYQYNGAAWVKM